MSITGFLLASIVASSTSDVADYTPERVDLTALARLETGEPAASPGMLALQEDLPEETPTAEIAPAYGTKDTWRIGVWLAGGSSVESARNSWVLLGGLEFSYFFLENVSLELQFNAVYANQQSGRDAVGGNFALLFRWHFIDEDTWSLYLDGGAGAALFSEEVPFGGTNFNFTPQAGCGVSFALKDTDARLLLGVRWLHISNGSTSTDNPGLDTVIGYVGLSWPF